ncbi:glycosyltransferase family 39 protein [Candidatus Curtissbacteria bacterium]|nr:glycosyltransferase family 39 protein [Candidatus Curtissbacteria bacterium]
MIKLKPPGISRHLLVFFLIVFTVALFIRFYNLSLNPPGLYWDEAAFGYDAYSILHTGKDQHGAFLPLFFQSYGDWKLPGYFYILIPSISLFGLNEFAIRFPSFLFGLLTIVWFYFLVRRGTSNKILGLFAAAMLALSSWHIQFSRAGFESVPALFIFVLALVLFLKSPSSKKTLSSILSFVFFALTMYIYHAYRIFTPLFLVGLTVLFYKEIKTRKKNFLLSLAIFILISLPLIFFTLTPNGLNRASSQSNFNRDEFKQERLDFDQRSKPPFRFLSSKIYNEPLYIAELTAKNYLENFSPSFLFLRGDQIGRHSQVDMGQLHIFEFILIAIALFNLKNVNKTFLKIMLLWLILSPLPAAIVAPNPHAQRSLQMVIPLAFFSGLGAYSIYSSKLKLPKIIIFVWAVLVIVIFTRHLFVIYPRKFAADWQDGYRRMVTAVQKYEPNYQKIYITKINNVPYIYTLIYTNYDPAKYLESGSPEGFGKYQFVGVNEPIYGKGKALYVAPPWQKIDGVLKEEIRDNGGNVVYKIWNLGGEN